MHGGISQKITNLDSLRKTKKPENIPDDGLLCDLMWADPMDDEDAIRGEFKDNPERECSNYFGKKPVKQLLRRNKLLSVFRGH